MIKTIRNGFVKCKIALIGLVFIFPFFNYYCQTNLVPNNNFDFINSCPIFYEICEATPWFQPIKCPEPDGVCNCGSTELFHSCANTVPNNILGFQIPKSGDAFSGLTIYQSNDQNFWREYLEVKLITPLISNKKYCGFWYASLANYSRNGVNRIGAHFSSDTLFQISYNYIPVLPQIENTAIIIDTTNWILYNGIFEAQGGEQFMTIGNFRPGSMVDTSNIITNSSPWAYYYFDDFGVYELPEIEAGSGGTICEYAGSVQLQANCEGCWDGLQYRWWPSAGLSDSTVLNPIATPEQTTTYYFGLIDTTETVPCIADLVDSVTVSVCDGIKPSVFNFNIQPNPGHDNVELKFTNISEVTELFLFDMRGRIIFKDLVLKDSESYTLNLVHFANAQYILKLENSTGAIRKKLIKM